MIISGTDSRGIFTLLLGLSNIILRYESIHLAELHPGVFLWESCCMHLSFLFFVTPLKNTGFCDFPESWTFLIH